MFLLLVLIRNPVAFIRAVCLDFAPGHWDMRLGAEAIAYHLQWEDVSRKGLVGFVAGWYTEAHLIARLQLYGAGRDYALKGNVGKYVWRKIFGPVTPGPQQLYQLAEVANKTTGNMALRVLGVSATQQQIESILVFPRYLRCVIGLVIDPLQGGLKGNEARRLLAQMALAGVAIYLLLTVL